MFPIMPVDFPNRAIGRWGEIYGGQMLMKRDHDSRVVRHCGDFDRPGDVVGNNFVKNVVVFFLVRVIGRTVRADVRVLTDKPMEGITVGIR